jgi:flagellar motor protein MotB
MNEILVATRQLALAQARALARHGRYAEAEELLDEAWQDAEPGVAVLDLRARIHAQQGRLEQADECWARAQRLAPDDPEIADGRRRIARSRGTRRSSVRVVPAVAAAVALALLVDLRLEPARPAAPPPPTAAAALPSTGGDVMATMNLQVPGVRLSRLPGELSISFEEGLFADGAALSPHGRALLETLGRRLRPYASRVEVVVIGHTDDLAVPPGGDYANNVELGGVRAAVVREVLHDAAGIPTARFSVSSMGGTMRPSRGDGTGLGEVGPGLYRDNAFRVTGLAVDATPRDIRRRSDRLRMMNRLGTGQDDEPVLLPPGEPVDAEAYEQAVQRLRDPVCRLVDELFWFWPVGGTDPAMDALRRGETDEAARIWRDSSSAVAAHNLAVLTHVRALEDGGPWERAFAHWRAVVDDDRVTWRTTTVSIPRCAACRAVASRRTRWTAGISAPVVSVMVGGTLMLFGGGHVGLGLLLSLCDVLCFIVMAATMGSATESLNAIREFAPIRQRLSEGWRFGEKPPNTN